MADFKYIDVATLEAVNAGLGRGHLESLNPWQRRSLLDTTSCLVCHEKVRLATSAGRRASQSSLPPELEKMRSILMDSIEEKMTPYKLQRDAKSETESIILSCRSAVIASYSSLMNTESLNDLQHFQWTHTAPYDARRLGGLIDADTLKLVGKVLDLSRSEIRDLTNWVNSPQTLSNFAKNYAVNDSLSAVPEILLHAHVMGCIVRGTYYKEVARLQGAGGVWHPLRDLGASVQSSFINAPLGVQFVVGMIISGSMLEPSVSEACSCWAKNISRARSNSFDQLYENDERSAERSAIEFAKRAKLDFPSTQIERVVELVNNYLLDPLLLLVGLALHVEVPVYSPTAAVEALGGPIRDRLQNLTENQVKRHVVGIDEEYRHLIREAKTSLFAETGQKQRSFLH